MARTYDPASYDALSGFPGTGVDTFVGGIQNPAGGIFGNIAGRFGGTTGWCGVGVGGSTGAGGYVEAWIPHAAGHGVFLNVPNLGTTTSSDAVEGWPTAGLTLGFEDDGNGGIYTRFAWANYFVMGLRVDTTSGLSNVGFSKWTGTPTTHNGESNMVKVILNWNRFGVFGQIDGKNVIMQPSIWIDGDATYQQNTWAESVADWGVVTYSGAYTTNTYSGSGTDLITSGMFVSRYPEAPDTGTIIDHDGTGAAGADWQWQGGTITDVTNTGFPISASFVDTDGAGHIRLQGYQQVVQFRSNEVSSLDRPIMGYSIDFDVDSTGDKGIRLSLSGGDSMAFLINAPDDGTGGIIGLQTVDEF